MNSKKLAGFFVSMIFLSGCSTMPFNLFSGSQQVRPVPEPVQKFKDMRNMVLTLDPTTVGINPTPQNPNVWGVLMEMGLNNGVATLVSLADGSTSMYYGSGGAMIGGGGYPTIANASREFVVATEQYFRVMSSTTSFPTPNLGRLKFYVLTFSGTYTIDEDITDLSNGKHLLSPLYYKGQEVITHFRLLSFA